MKHIQSPQSPVAPVAQPVRLKNKVVVGDPAFDQVFRKLFGEKQLSSVVTILRLDRPKLANTSEESIVDARDSDAFLKCARHYVRDITHSSSNHWSVRMSKPDTLPPYDRLNTVKIVNQTQVRIRRA